MLHTYVFTYVKLSDPLLTDSNNSYDDSLESTTY